MKLYQFAEMAKPAGIRHGLSMTRLDLTISERFAHRSRCAGGASPLLQKAESFYGAISWIPENEKAFRGETLRAARLLHREKFQAMFFQVIIEGVNARDLLALRIRE